jgi:hypothetical protein
MARPHLRVRWPRPPPRVRPPTPVVEMIPLGVASPCSPVARSTAPQMQPPPTRTVRACGSTSMSSSGEVDDHAVVARPQAGAVVAPAADGQEQAVVAGEADGCRDVVGTGAARDQRGALVDQRVVDLARLVVVGLVGPDQPSLEPRELLTSDLGGRGDRAHASPFGWRRATLTRRPCRVMTQTDRVSSRLELRGACRDDQV